MELTLKDYKYIKNTGTFPTELSQKLMEWQNALYQYNEGNSDVPGAVDTSILPKPGSFDIAGMSAQSQLKQAKDIPHQDVSANNTAKHTRNIDWRQAFGGATGVINNTLDAAMNYTTQDDFHAGRSYSTGNAFGVSYRKAKVDRSQATYNCGKMPKYGSGRTAQNIFNGAAQGASAGAAFGPIGIAAGTLLGIAGGAIGSGIGAAAEKKALENELRLTNADNTNNYSSAGTQGIRQRNALRDGNPLNQTIGFACGKLPKYSGGKPVFTSDGFTTDKKQTAWVSGQEGVMGADGTISVVPGPPTQRDDVPANIKPSDTVFRVEDMDYIYRTGDVQGALARLALSKKYKSGKMPGFAEGWAGNAIPATMGVLAGLGQTLNAYRNKPYYPNTYVGNPYESTALTTLAGLNINPYPVINLLRNAEARTNRAIDIAGGLSGGLRTAARLAALNTTQGNISKLLSDIQQQNNAYRANYAQAAINAGQQARQARMSANQWDLDYYSKAHAARNKGIQTGIANMLAQIQQYQANEFKRRQFNDTMDLYRADQKQRNEQNQWVRNWYANQPTRGIGADPAVGSLVNPSYTTWNTDDWNRYNLARGVIGAPAFPLINRRQS